MKIYTKTGDRGTTSLFGGKRVEKNSARIEAYGAVDELNSQLGTILSENPQPDIAKKLLRIQGELFVLGADLATPNEVKVKVPRVPKSFVTRLEREIDQWTKTLSPLKNFILPSGGKVGSQLHLARSVARRTERAIVTLASQEKINKQSLRPSGLKQSLRSSATPAGLKNALAYINRLSDWFFVMARYVNKLAGVPEKIWKGRG